MMPRSMNGGPRRDRSAPEDETGRTWAGREAGGPGEKRKKAGRGGPGHLPGHRFSCQRTSTVNFNVSRGYGSVRREGPGAAALPPASDVQGLDPEEAQPRIPWTQLCLHPAAQAPHLVRAGEEPLPDLPGGLPVILPERQLPGSCSLEVLQVAFQSHPVGCEHREVHLARPHRRQQAPPLFEETTEGLVHSALPSVELSLGVSGEAGTVAPAPVAGPAVSAGPASPAGTRSAADGGSTSPGRVLRSFDRVGVMPNADNSSLRDPSGTRTKNRILRASSRPSTTISCKRCVVACRLPVRLSCSTLASLVWARSVSSAVRRGSTPPTRLACWMQDPISPSQSRKIFAYAVIPGICLLLFCRSVCLKTARQPGGEILLGSHKLFPPGLISATLRKD